MTDRRPIYRGIVIVASVLFTPIFGSFGPFEGGDAPTGPREYFLPAGYAFSIWAVNYIGLLLLGVWQALPGQSANLRVRSAAPWLAVTALCNPIWIVLAGNPALVPWTVPTLIVMQIAAWIAYLRLRVNQPDIAERTERLLHLPFRVYVGWLSVATVANTAAALNVLQWDGFGVSPIIWTVIMLLVSTLLAWIVGRLANDDNVYRTVFVWAFVGITVQQADVPVVAFTAIAAALAVLAMIVVTQKRRNRKLAEPAISTA